MSLIEERSAFDLSGMKASSWFSMPQIVASFGPHIKQSPLFISLSSNNDDDNDDNDNNNDGDDDDDNDDNDYGDGENSNDV